ncbi:MAG: hypothetical protein D6731_04655 [Planctomycetota bacterium]|nr:MAG: hypothetical protein D6731_04655 [Planctomycetota bacterium]
MTDTTPSEAARCSATGHGAEAVGPPEEAKAMASAAPVDEAGGPPEDSVPRGACLEAALAELRAFVEAAGERGRCLQALAIDRGCDAVVRALRSLRGRIEELEQVLRAEQEDVEESSAAA